MKKNIQKGQFQKMDRRAFLKEGGAIGVEAAASLGTPEITSVHGKDSREKIDLFCHILPPKYNEALLKKGKRSFNLEANSIRQSGAYCRSARATHSVHARGAAVRAERRQGVGVPGDRMGEEVDQPVAQEGPHAVAESVPLHERVERGQRMEQSPLHVRDAALLTDHLVVSSTHDGCRFRVLDGTDTWHELPSSRHGLSQLIAVSACLPASYGRVDS